MLRSSFRALMRGLGGPVLLGWAIGALAPAAARAVTIPVALTVAIVASLELQVTLEVRSAVELSE